MQWMGGCYNAVWPDSTPNGLFRPVFVFVVGGQRSRSQTSKILFRSVSNELLVTATSNIIGIDLSA